MQITIQKLSNIHFPLNSMLKNNSQCRNKINYFIQMRMKEYK